MQLLSTSSQLFAAAGLKTLDLSALWTENLRCDETHSSCVNTRVHEWRLPPLKELTSASPLPSFLLFYHCVAATLRLSPFPTQPIRFLPSTQPLKPGVSDWCEEGGLWAGQGGGGGPHSLFLSVSPSECFSLTVCDSSWIGDCSHTLSPPMVDHMPRLPHPIPPFPSDPPPSLLQDSTWDRGNLYFQADCFSCSIRLC